MTKNQRMTKQKTAILEILRMADCHPTAEWLYQEARKKIPGISLGTVYRNLNQLRDNGEISELIYGSSQSRFDARQDMHYHFCCTRCGIVFDMQMPVIKSIESRARACCDYVITNHRLEYYGLCPVCREAEKAM